MKNGMGIIDDDAVTRGIKLGVNLTSGCKNKKDGRVRIFSRKFPGASKSGYSLRSRIIWWIYTGEVISGSKFDIHHKNHDRSDDRIDNLEKLLHSEHTHEHHGYRGDQVKMEMRICVFCHKEFPYEIARLRDKTHKGKYCSSACYHKAPRKRVLKIKTHCVNGHELIGGNTFKIIRVNGINYGCRICKRVATKKQNDKRKKCSVG